MSALSDGESFDMAAVAWWLSLIGSFLLSGSLCRFLAAGFGMPSQESETKVLKAEKKN